MKRTLIVLILTIILAAVDIVITYNQFGSLLWESKNKTEYEERSGTPAVREYERAERSEKLPQTEVECDFINQIDSGEYFKDNDAAYVEDEDKYLVSHNVFDMSDGDVMTVDILSADYANGEYKGKMLMYVSTENGRGVKTPCAYDSDVRSALKYTYKDHFSLLLDDYNNDGNPDYVLRTGEPEDDGAYYYIQYTVNEGYPSHHTNFSTEKGNSDSAVFIYNKQADSIRLDHTDMEHFFFLTYSDGEYVPYIYDSDFRKCDVSDFSVGDRLYSAFYENGVLTVKATDCTGKMEMYESNAEIILRKYNDRVWCDTDREYSIGFSPDKYDSRVNFGEINEKLEKGLYQLEIKTPDGTAYAEFMVRS